MAKALQRVYHIGLDARFFRGETGGIGRYSRELIHHLAAIDHTNQYTVFLTEADLPEWQLEQKNFKIRVVPAAHYSLAEQTKFLRILLQERCDLVHFLNFNHPILYRRPFVVTLHDLTMYFFPVGRSQKSWVRRLAFVTILKRALRSARRIIAISEYTAHDAEKQLGISHAKMEVILEGGPERRELPFGNKALVQEYLGSRQPYFLFVSQWRPHKGMNTLIEAFTIFKEKTKAPHQLVLLGNQKSASESLKQALANSPFVSDIITPGFAPDELLPSLYHNAVACVMPSEYEGFGLPVLEAFSYQTPVIVADNSSLPEVAGAGGLYFPTRDAAALADRLTEMVTTPGLAADLVAKGDQQLQKFSWDRMAKQTLQLYLSTLEKRR